MELIKGKLSVSDSVYNQILIKISEGYWKSGEKIPSEGQLCKMFQVSRVSVRSALQKLQALGVITTIQGIGSFVEEPGQPELPEIIQESDITKDTYHDFFDFRQMIEFKAIDLFISRAAKQELETIKSLAEEMAKFKPGDKRLDDCDYKFHQAIIHGSKNNFIINSMEMYKDFYYHYIEEIHRLVPITGVNLSKKHIDMYQSIVDQNPNIYKKILLEDALVYQQVVFKK